MSEAPTPEEIAAEICAWWDNLPGGEAALGLRIEQALRAYGDRRYCEARDAAADLAQAVSDRNPWLRTPAELTEAIRKLTPWPT